MAAFILAGPQQSLVGISRDPDISTKYHRKIRRQLKQLGESVRTMTELKRRLSIDHSSPICSPMKSHRTQVPISTRERKDKVGERISALQELVSPYGKTDTASVLLEAMGYIKFLQDQVQVLSAPYLQSAPATQEESEYCSLRSRGLCLVPVEWTLKVARSNGADMWAPTMTASKF